MPLRLDPRSVEKDGDSTSTAIPKIIIQTNETGSVPKGMFDASRSLIDANPEYQYIYYTDTTSRKFLLENFPRRVVDAYDELIPGAYKADLFRYCVLWITGGVYIDMGMVAVTPLRDII